MSEKLNLYQPSEMHIELSTHAKCLRMIDGPLPLEIPLDGKALLFPAGVDGSKALMEATRIFWRHLEWQAPGWKVSE